MSPIGASAHAHLIRVSAFPSQTAVAPAAAAEVGNAHTQEGPPVTHLVFGLSGEPGDETIVQILPVGSGPWSAMTAVFASLECGRTYSAYAMACGAEENCSERITAPQVQTAACDVPADLESAPPIRTDLSPTTKESTHTDGSRTPQPEPAANPFPQALPEGSMCTPLNGDDSASAECKFWCAAAAADMHCSYLSLIHI